MSKIKWVLGFDGNCYTCSKIARKIESISEGKVTAQSLHSPQVRAWNVQTSRHSTSLIPVLLEIKDEQVYRWIGWQMSWQLLQLLGLRKAWQIVWTVGKSDLAEEQSTDPKRRRFVKYLIASMSLAAIISTGRKSFFSKAVAADSPFHKFTVLSADATTHI